MDLIHNVNSFELIRNIKTDLLYGNLSQFPNARISIAIPTYKRHDALKEAIKSALFQNSKNKDYYIIVVDNDDSDSDKVLELVKSFDDKHLIYFKNQKNLGMEQNWNRAIELAPTPFVALLHDDDLLCPNFLDVIDKVIKQADKKTVCYVNAYYQYDKNYAMFHDDIKSKDNIFDSFVKSCFMLFGGNKLTTLKSWYTYFTGNFFGAPTCGILINKDLMLETGGFNPKFHPLADWCMFQYLASNRKYKIRFIHKSIGIYRWDINASFNPEVSAKADRGNIEFMDSVIQTDSFVNKIHNRFNNSKLKKIIYPIFTKIVGIKTFSKRKVIRSLSEIGITNLK